MPLISIKGLYKSYGQGPGRVEVLKGVDLAVEQGESVAILGASGVGKSTLLNIMGALDRPTDGEVLYRDNPLFKLDEKSLAQFRNTSIGFVFQSHHLLPEFTALENVMLPALIHGEDRQKARVQAERLLKDVGLGSRLTHKPGELSGGEQQRVAITRALVRTPEVVLADEPTGNLDAKTGGEVFDLLLRLNRGKNITLIVVTHNESLAGRLTRRLLMVDGKIQEQ